MGCSWTTVLLLFTIFYVSGEEIKSCYKVKKISNEKCVYALDVTEEGEGWFSGSCSSPYRLHKIHQGEISIATTSIDKILSVIDSEGRPYILTIQESSSRQSKGHAHTVVNGTLVTLSEDDGILEFRGDNHGNMFLTSRTAAYRSRDEATVKIQGVPEASGYHSSDDEGNAYFQGGQGTLFVVKDDKVTKKLFEGQNVWAFIKNPDDNHSHLAATNTGIFKVKDDLITPVFRGGPIYEMVSRRDGVICFSTPDSVFLMKSGDVSPVEDLEKIHNLTKILLAVDTDDKIYMHTVPSYTLPHQLYVLKAQEMSPRGVNGIPSSSDITRIVFDSHNNVFLQVGNKDSTVSLYFLPKNSLQARLVDEVKGSLNNLASHNNILYVGTQEGLYLLESNDNCSM